MEQQLATIELLQLTYAATKKAPEPNAWLLLTKKLMQVLLPTGDGEDGHGHRRSICDRSTARSIVWLFFRPGT
jgi:hypothetical protein